MEEKPAEPSPETPGGVEDEAAGSTERDVSICVDFAVFIANCIQAAVEEKSVDPSPETPEGGEGEPAASTEPDVSITLVSLWSILTVYRPLWKSRNRWTPLRRPLKWRMMSRLSRLNQT